MTKEGTIGEVSAISIHSATKWTAQPREAIISITGTGEPQARLKKGWAFTLRLCFDDIEAPRAGQTLFSDDHANQLIDFLDEIEDTVDHVVVHCTQGLSRSPAIARYISKRYDLTNGFDSHRTFNRHVFSTVFRRWRHRVAPGKGCLIDMGWLRADDPIYRMGPIVAGRAILQPQLKKKGGRT